MELNSQILEGNALQLLPTFPAASVDVVITSPRYNFGKNYPGVCDQTSPAVYFNEMKDLGKALLRVVRDTGVIFLNVGCRSKDPLHDVQVAQQFIEAGWVLQERIIWQKADEFGNGHFTPINSDRYLNNLWESIFLFSKTGSASLDRLAIGVPYKDTSNIKRWKHGRTTHCRGDIWYLPYETIQSRESERDGHEATFPQALVHRCLTLIQRDRRLIVLDPCCGIGTVPCIAIEHGHIGIGIDLSPEIAQSAKSHLQESLNVNHP